MWLGLKINYEKKQYNLPWGYGYEWTDSEKDTRLYISNKIFGGPNKS